jgi:septal ring factor EnvC (AmiA/AmiB activator)
MVMTRAQLLALIAALAAAAGAGTYALLPGDATALAMSPEASVQWQKLNDDLLPQANALAEAVQSLQSADEAVARAEVALADARKDREAKQAALTALKLKSEKLHADIAAAVEVLSAADVPASIKTSGQMVALSQAIAKPQDPKPLVEVNRELVVKVNEIALSVGGVVTAVPELPKPKPEADAGKPIDEQPIEGEVTP